MWIYGDEICVGACVYVCVWNVFMSMAEWLISAVAPWIKPSRFYFFSILHFNAYVYLKKKGKRLKYLDLELTVFTKATSRYVILSCIESFFYFKPNTNKYPSSVLQELSWFHSWQIRSLIAVIFTRWMPPRSPDKNLPLAKYVNNQLSAAKDQRLREILVEKQTNTHMPQNRVN